MEEKNRLALSRGMREDESSKLNTEKTDRANEHTRPFGMHADGEDHSGIYSEEDGGAGSYSGEDDAGGFYPAEDSAEGFYRDDVPGEGFYPGEDDAGEFFPAEDGTEGFYQEGAPYTDYYSGDDADADLYSESNDDDGDLYSESDDDGDFYSESDKDGSFYSADDDDGNLYSAGDDDGDLYSEADEDGDSYFEGDGAAFSAPAKSPSGAAAALTQSVKTAAEQASIGQQAAADPSGQTAQTAAEESGTGTKELENTLAQVKNRPRRETLPKKDQTYREKILRHKKRVYRRTVIFVLLLTLALMTAVILGVRRGFRSAELRRVATLSARDGTYYESLGGNVVQYGAEGAVCIDRRGNTLWEVAYEMQQPITSVSGNVIAIANRSGYYIYVMDTGGLLGTIHTMLPIQNIAASESGEVAVIMNDSGAAWIRLYTAEGKEIAYIVRTMAENGYPIAAAVSPDGRTLCLSSIQMSNSTVKSNVSFYNFGKDGEKANDHLVENADYIDEVIPCLRYIDNATCVGVSDKRLFFFKKSLFQSPVSENILFSENLQGTFFSESFTGLLFTNTKEDSQYRLDLYNKRGKKAGTVRFTMPYTDILISGDRIYIHNDRQCQIFTLGGRCLFDGTLDKTIRTMIPGAGISDLLVITGGEIDSVSLH